MATERTKFTVGLFVAGGLGIGLLAFIWLGMSGVIHKGKHYATYFNESVQGLDVDSPVKYRGVSIGRVVKIEVAPDSRLIEVILRIDPGHDLGEDIVAQLTPVGITGKMFVELDRRKKGEPDGTPELDFVSEYPIIASKPSDISRLLHGLDDMLRQFRSLDLKGISDKVKGALDNIATLIEEARIKDVSSSIKDTFDSANRILQNKKWDGIIASVDEAAVSFNQVMDQTKKTMSAAEGALTRADGIVASEEETLKTAFEDFGKAMENAKTLLEKGSSLMEGTENSVFLLRRHLLVVSKNLERASENLNRLIEFLSDQPSQLIFDSPPAPRRIEEQNQREGGHRGDAHGTE